MAGAGLAAGFGSTLAAAFGSAFAAGLAAGLASGFSSAFGSALGFGAGLGGSGAYVTLSDGFCGSMRMAARASSAASAAAAGACTALGIWPSGTGFGGAALGWGAGSEPCLAMYAASACAISVSASS